MRAITISGKRGRELEGEWGGVCGGFQGSKGKEKCYNYIIILKINK